jgi:hypothetical protein
MRKSVLLVSFVLTAFCLQPALLVPAAPSALEFSAPTFDSPYYSISGKFPIQGTPMIFKSLAINGAPAAHFLVMKEGKPADLTKALAPGNYDVIIRHAWISNKAYQVSIAFQSGDAPKEMILDWAGTAPDRGGVPSPAGEGFFRVFKIQERAGIARQSEIVSLTLTAPKSEIEKRDFFFFDGNKSIPYQILDVKESVPTESQAKTHPVTLTCKIVLPLDAEARQKKILLAFTGGGSAAAEKGFEMSGDGLGKTVKTSRLAIGLSPKSGQVNTIEYLKEGIKLHNEKAGVIHWNPDVFVPGIAWDHSFDWNPPASFAELEGAFVYINARKGPMPRIKDVNLEVKYTIEKDAPYFISETLMTVEKDMGVIALRNDEMVLYKKLFDTLVYKDPREGLVKKPLAELAGHPYGLVHVAPSSAPWVGLVNIAQKYGFFSIRIEETSANLDAAGGFEHKAGTYFYAPSDGEYVYWVRPYLYTWGDYVTSTQLTFLPRGSFFYEKNAYVLLPWDDTTVEMLDELAQKLKNPLRAF